MAEGFNLENWRTEEDPIMDLKTEDEKTVKESMQSVRDEKAKELRSLRVERDKKRKDAEAHRVEAKKLSNKILKYVRHNDHPLHPDILNKQAEVADAEGDVLKKKATDESYLFSEIREKKIAEEIVDKETVRVSNMLQALNSTINDHNDDEFISRPLPFLRIADKIIACSHAQNTPSLFLF